MNTSSQMADGRHSQITCSREASIKRLVLRSAFIVVLFLFLLAPTALSEQPNPFCRAMEAAPKANPNDPMVKQAIDIWRKVNDPFEFVTGRKTALTVLGRHAQWYGRAFPPSAYLCSGAPAVVYLSFPLLEKTLVDRQYPEDLLAFVLAHELGHRFNDLDRAGQTTLQAFDRPGRGVNDEEMADKRAAFYIAAAGYSTRTLAYEATVSFFLKNEFNYRPSDLHRRKQQLLSVLDSFDMYETVYQTAMTLAFTDQRGSALRLLAWGDELIQGNGVALTEMKLARAQVLMMEAAPYAPWITEAKLPVDVSHLRCLPIYPAHTALWEEPRQYSISRSLSRPEEAKRQLIEAMWLLERADMLGADPLVTASSKACVAFYLGDAPNAQRYQSEAWKRTNVSAPVPVRAALDANEALVAFLGYLLNHPFPAKSDPGTASKWIRAASKVQKAFVKNEQLAELLKELAALASSMGRADLTLQHPQKKPSKEKIAEVSIFELPRHIPMSLGGCPAGWQRQFNVPIISADSAGTTDMGLTVCHPLTGDPTRRLVKVRLPETTEPLQASADIKLLYVVSLSGLLKQKSTWLDNCTQMDKSGVALLGETVYTGQCPELGLPFGTISVSSDDQVLRAVRIEN